MTPSTIHQMLLYIRARLKQPATRIRLCIVLAVAPGALAFIGLSFHRSAALALAGALWGVIVWFIGRRYLATQIQTRSDAQRSPLRAGGRGHA